MLELNKVTKLFGGETVALEDVSFHLAKGEFLSLVGPNQSGKTTLLKLIAAQERPTEGEIVFDQFSSREMQGKQIALMRRKLGLISQDFKLTDQVSVFDNVALGLRILGKKEKEIKRQVDRALDSVGLFAKSKTSPARLSSAEQQKVAVARAMVRHPLLLLADEPTLNLDQAGAEEILKLLRRVNVLGTAVILTSRKALPDNGIWARVMRLEKGRILPDHLRPSRRCGGSEHHAGAGDNPGEKEHP